MIYARVARFYEITTDVQIELSLMGLGVGREDTSTVALDIMMVYNREYLLRSIDIIRRY